MSDDFKDHPERYYEEYVKQLEEIQRYKWIESQKSNEDIGFERALTEWVSKHRDIWRAERQAKLATKK